MKNDDSKTGAVVEVIRAEGAVMGGAVGAVASMRLVARSIADEKKASSEKQAGAPSSQSKSKEQK